MDGSEPGDVVAAAVLSGAPIDLQARCVRYVHFPSSTTSARLTKRLLKYLQTCKDCYTVGGLARPPLAHGLGHPTQRASMGEPTDGVAIIRRLDARHTLELQN